jgi:hypothetical protein
VTSEKVMSGKDAKWLVYIRFQKMIDDCTQRMFENNMVNPDLTRLGDLTQALLTLFYSFDMFTTELKSKELEDEVLNIEGRVITYNDNKNHSIKDLRQLLWDLRTIFRKSLCIVQEVGLGIELKSGTVNVKERLQQIIRK